MRKLHCWVLLGFVLVGWGAHGQPQNLPPGEIAIDIPNTYITTYRDQSWVPVDVFVGNNKEDIQGYVEVACSGPGGAQHPTYRAPVESPKGSVKRFRVYCRFDTTLGLKARLCTKKGHQIGPDFPLRGLTPIQEGVLGVVLDEEAGGFGFLRDAVNFGGGDERMYRINLATKDLAFLPDMPQCYDSYDVIITGDIDPTRISPKQRDFIVDFVSRGGGLIITTGEHTPALRGTWLEELAGVSFGEVQSSKEGEAGRQFFNGDKAANLREDWPVLLTDLKPQLPGVKTFGKRATLAAQRTLGKGFVTTFAADASSKAFHKCPGYLALWQQVCTNKTMRIQPRFREAALEYARQVPNLAGLRIYPRSTVLTYLVLYFLIAIVGNWVFWSFMKRREMAWVCLVLFSIAFTSFAMIYGSAGRAKAAEVQQVEVLEIPTGEGMGRLRAMVGVLTARTTSYSVDVPGDYNLVSDLTRSWVRGSRSAWGSTEGFYFHEGPKPHVGGFVVGASELRVLEVEARVPTKGIEGHLVRDDSGLRGTLVDTTGLGLKDAVLIIDGHAFQVNSHNGQWEVSISEDRFDIHSPSMPLEQVRRCFGGHSIRAGNGHVNSYRQIAAIFAADLFRAADDAGGQDPSLANSGNELLSPAIGPYLCAFIDSSGTAEVNVSPAVPKHTSQTLVLAEVEIATQSSVPRDPASSTTQGLDTRADVQTANLQRQP